MNYLSIDTSGTHLTVIANKCAKTIINYTNECNMAHSVLLLPNIEKTLKEAEMTLDDIEVFACVLGAGSFTGVRIGVSTVKAFCMATGAKSLGVTSFETLAYNKLEGKTLAAIDAKHGNYYICGFENGKKILAESFVDRQKLNELSMEYNVVVSSPIDGLICEVVSIKEGLKIAVEINLSKAVNDVESLHPVYVKKSQAEENL